MANAVDDNRWVTSAVLAALAARSKRAGDTFTSVQLREWVPGLQVGHKFRSASQKLLKLKFVTGKQTVDITTTFTRYTITPEGAAAIDAIASGRQHKSGGRGPHAQGRTPGNKTMISRLWALMRARGMLNAEDAASTLVDAGDDVTKAARHAQRCMARWAAVGAVTESRVREANGYKRYVLVKDSLTPPDWTVKAQARKASTPTQSRAQK